MHLHISYDNPLIELISMMYSIAAPICSKQPGFFTRTHADRWNFPLFHYGSKGGKTIASQKLLKCHRPHVVGTLKWRNPHLSFKLHGFFGLCKAVEFSKKYHHVRRWGLQLNVQYPSLHEVVNSQVSPSCKARLLEKQHQAAKRWENINGDNGSK